MQANEKAIWENWNIQLPQGSPVFKPIGKANISKHLWLPPPRHRFKLNFDGASKGNPGKAGFGGIFRDHKGSPLLIYLGNIGWDTNNSAELEGLWQGLLIAQHHGFQPLEIEGDSQILINMGKQLLNGAHADKISNSWRLEAKLEAIETILNANRAIIFKHVRWESNKVVDLLANLGVENRHSLLTGALDII